MQENDKDSLQEVMQGQKTEEAETVIPEDKGINSEEEGTEVIDPEKKRVYKKTKKLKKSIKYMVTCDEKVEMYKRAADKFEGISGFRDADELADTCKQLAIKTRKKVRNLTYEKALELKNNAKSADDYKSAVKEFRKIKGYLDSDTLAAECERLYEKMESRSSTKKMLRSCAIILGILVLLVGSRTSHAKYYLANTYMFTGAYTSAANIYRKMGPYKDCEDRLAKCRYLSGKQYEAKGEYVKAKVAYGKANNYKDSDAKKVEMEKIIIKNSQVTDKIWLANYRWKIIAKEDGKALLMMTKILPPVQYNIGSGSATWETSTVRKWLNSDFLNKNFSEAEKKNLVLTDVLNVSSQAAEADACKMEHSISVETFDKLKLFLNKINK
jgi:tetratricopeptide (TPR) repeat protein